jgi:uncharacterized iron-regulated membrane protein
LHNTFIGRKISNIKLRRLKMCMFCATAPAVAAMGVGMQAKQRRERKAAEARGEAPQKSKVPAGPATIVIVLGLLVISAIIHSNNYA